MVCCRHTFGGDAPLHPWKVSPLTDRVQDDPHPESLAALARLLEQYSTGSGRITPRPRGSRLSPDVRAILEDALAAVESAANGAIPLGGLLVYGNGCYAVGRHADASNVYLSILENEPANAEARFNLGLAHLARGNVDRAREVYRQALTAHGAEEGHRIGAARDLEDLIARGVQVREARRILAAFGTAATP